MAERGERGALAAGALCHAIGIDDVAIAKALRAFKGLPHRVEKIETIDGVTYYDDSKGTNVGSTVAALGGFVQPVVLIAGGDGKGQDFTPLRDPVRQRARPRHRSHSSATGLSAIRGGLTRWLGSVVSPASAISSTSGTQRYALGGMTGRVRTIQS